MGGSLSGKVALVTGASSGIGAASVKALLDAGSKVVAVARRLDRLKQIAEVNGAGTDRLFLVQTDVQNDKAVAELADKVRDWGGGLDILINNAGVSRGSPNEQASVEEMRMMLDTNVFALANVTRVLTPALRASKGIIVNLSSTAARAALPNGALYSASKAAVATFSESLRKELVPHEVRVVTIFPGFVDTDLFDAFNEEKKKEFARLRQAIDPLQPEDLARLILFAVSQPAHVALNEIVIRPTKQLP